MEGALELVGSHVLRRPGRNSAQIRFYFHILYKYIILSAF